MLRKIGWVAITAAALGLALSVGVAYGGISDIFGSAHDLGSPGNPTCKQCHMPHNAQGAYLWARTPKTGMSGLQALCFSCHDGSITSVGQFIADPNLPSHPVEPGVEGKDCDRCHDPHEDNWKFVTDSAIPSAYRNANVCRACHDTGGFTHPLAATNKPIDRTWDPYASPPDFSGTRLWDQTGTQVVPTGTAHIRCATCHVPHGAAAYGELNSMNYWDPNSNAAPICENCHY